MKFTHLHVHTHYSLLDGMAKIDPLLDFCWQQEMSALAITDHGNLYGAVEFYQKAKKRGIKPVIGCEVYIAYEKMDQRRPNIDDKRYHLVLLVKDKEGYRNLVKLVTKSHLEGFYYKPRIDRDLLKKHSQGLIGLSACVVGEIPRAIINGKLEQAEKLALEYQNIFGKENFYLELEHHSHIPEQKIVNESLIKISQKTGIGLVATNDVHYIKPEDAEAQDVLMAINTDKKSTDLNRLTMKNDNFSLRSPAEMIELFKDMPQAISNTQKIVEQCNFNFELGKIQLPHFEVPDQQTPDSYLAELCQKGLEKHYGQKPTPDVLSRLDYELEVIKKTGFASYFLIVADFVNWAKSQNIVCGPGRGSAAGSIISYLLNITEVDPLKYNLLFERFLTPERAQVSMPDIDLDFADDRRDEVINYVRQKYGEDHVAQIITFGTMASRAAVRDVGRALDYTYSFCDQIAKMIPFGLPLEKAIYESQELHNSYESDEATKKLIDTALKLEGVARHASTHAAGVVITKDPIDNLVPRQHPTQDQQIIVTQYEMHSIEDLGLLKMDFLGLKTLTIIENIIKQVKERLNQEVDIEKLPLDDKKTFQLYQQANTTGVFQMESAGFKRYLKDLKPSQIEDLIAMVALYRPGPMEFIPEFISRKHGHRKIQYLHPDLKPILENTYGICVYQEQLMQIAQNLAGFTLTEADALRKAVGKKIKKLLDEQKDKMIDGMIKNRIVKETAERIWDFVEPFARYGFNKSHASCYALLGYQTAYLKAHFPTEFMAALMTSDQNDIERIAFLVSESKQIGIEVLPPDINESNANFTVIKDGVIRFGLRAIKNVGHNIVQTIVDTRKASGPYKSIVDFIERVQSKDLNKKSMESLIRCGALDKFAERNLLLHNLEQMLGFAREIQKAKQNGQASLFGGSSVVEAPNFKFEQIEAAASKQCLAWEKELLGLYISQHPCKNYQAKLAKAAIPCQMLTRNHVGKQVRVGGIVNKIKKINTRSGQPMLFVELEDLTGKIEAIVFTNILEQTAGLWQQDKIVVVRGKVTDRDGNLKIICNDVKVIE